MIVVTKPLHHKLTRDDVVGDQKFHEGNIPRVGGVALFATLIFGYYISLITFTGTNTYFNDAYIYCWFA